MDTEIVVTGAIVDSWVEPPGTSGDGSRLVLQVAPQGRPKDLMIVEAEASLVPDRGWLEDLGENHRRSLSSMRWPLATRSFPS